MNKGKPGRPDYVKQIISFFKENPNASQIDCAEKLRIDKDTVNKILNRTPKFSYLKCEQIPETQDDPYVALAFITPKGEFASYGSQHGFIEHSDLLQKSGVLKAQGNKVYLITRSQIKKGFQFSPRFSDEDYELQKIKKSHGWGKKK